MTKESAIERLDELIRKYLRVPREEELDDSNRVASLAADWRIIDLAIAVETEFGIPMSADKALELLLAYLQGNLPADI